MLSLCIIVSINRNRGSINNVCESSIGGSSSSNSSSGSRRNLNRIQNPVKHLRWRVLQK